MDRNARNPPAIHTNNPSASHNRRFSYAETPIDVQRDQGFGGRGQQYRHNQEALQEAETPVEGGGRLDGYHMQTRSPAVNPYADSMPQTTQATQATQQPVRPQRMSSPYGVPEPTGVHPAYYAPVVSQTPPNVPTSQPLQHPPSAYTAVPNSGTINTETQLQDPSQGRRRTSTVPMQSEADARQPQSQHPHSPTKKQHGPIQPDHVTIPYSPTHITSPTAPIFAPAAAIGPNGLASAEMHQPGQVAHPNMHNIQGSTSDKDSWAHSLCECNADMGTCLMGLFCPCVLDSRTSYRMGRKSGKKDPTDMLGFKSCNARCVFFNCGLCCEYCLPFDLLSCRTDTHG